MVHTVEQLPSLGSGTNGPRHRAKVTITPGTDIKVLDAVMSRIAYTTAADLGCDHTVWYVEERNLYYFGTEAMRDAFIAKWSNG